ncbi:helix-turn-helix transcriptional regulator [Streptomyces sp. NPDC048518]|uniref:helix-turn-helix domain-containing protein n=1 Tax=Streptomyces sp. NPDC048518 TaxID=3155029 RepID=UPI0033E39122
MRTHAPNWGSPRARALIEAGDVGGLIRWARVELGWRQVDLGKATGYSASAVSRLETAERSATDLDMIRNFAQALFIPAGALAAVLRVTPSPRTKVAADAGRHTEAEEDSMRRRSLLQAAGLAVPLSVLNGFDESLALLPSPASAPTSSNLMTQFRRARALFDVGDHKKLVLALPDLLATGHACAEDGEADDYMRLAACYDLATEALSKIGRYSASRITADRSNIFSELSGSPLAAAASARAFSIVLRHEDRGATAQRVTLHAAAKVEATGLKTPAQAATFAQMLCTVAYAAAQAGDRDRAVEMIGAAERAAKLLPDRHGRPQTFSVTPASVALYKVGVLWGLGDAGAAVHAGKDLRPGQFPTAERRGRLHTDMARAWWQWGKADETAAALLAAHREAPAEVRDRPSMRAIVTELAERHPRTASVRQLAAAVHARST